jgi:hypothetical protein
MPVTVKMEVRRQRKNPREWQREKGAGKSSQNVV